ncbi:uncharacterized protein LOC127359606 [Dicentrarchus labrax]|uniref:Ig-like domain-containing protein n=1 Tax=Dicentrarchus labrax TaxID=13489 RepID=A0A8P4FVP1_DICLA|nr:uncharacterized protein LOC127359606 [Dicentrarchus labrax]
MRHTSVCGLLLLCVHFLFVNTRSASQNVQCQDVPPTPFYLSSVFAFMEVSPPRYLSVGDTVELNCTTFSIGWNRSETYLHLVWTKMDPGNRTKTVLVSQRGSKVISYRLGPVTHEHQGVYSCDIDLSSPNVKVFDWHQIIWVADDSPRASIYMMSHNRNQFLPNEIFTVSCHLPDGNTHWKMMRFDKSFGTITECPNQVSSDRRLSCTVCSEYPWSEKLYWCENPAGERSNSLNINTAADRVVLERPSLPVTEGEDVILRCLHRKPTQVKFSFNFNATYYKNDQLIGNTIDSLFTLKAVTKADEGVYKCRHPEDGDSSDSWITVKARPVEDQNKKITTS